MEIFLFLLKLDTPHKVQKQTTNSKKSFGSELNWSGFGSVLFETSNWNLFPKLVKSRISSQSIKPCFSSFKANSSNKQILLQEEAHTESSTSHVLWCPDWPQSSKGQMICPNRREWGASRAHTLYSVSQELSCSFRGQFAVSQQKVKAGCEQAVGRDRGNPGN